MARLWTSGFELQSMTSAVEWDTVSNAPTINTTTKRSGNAAMRVQNTTATTRYAQQQFATNAITSDIFIRVYVYIASAPSVQTTIIQPRNASGNAPEIRLNTDRTLELWDTVSSVQLGSASSALSLNTWHRIEIHLLQGTGGSFCNSAVAYLDGIQFASGTPVTTPAAAYILRMGVITSATVDIYFDDIAINDETGTNQNGLPGDGKVGHLLPNGSGDNAMGARGGADSGTDYGQIDEVTPNDATDYYILDVNNDIFDVALQPSSTLSIASTDYIALVQVGARHVPATAAITSYKARLKSQSNGTLNEGTTTTHNDTTWRTNGDALPRNYTLTSYADPQNGLTWTTSRLDDAQAGIQVVDADPDLWVSTLWALVEWRTPPTSTIALDAVSSGRSGGANSVTFAHTTSGSDRILVVQISIQDSNHANLPVTSVTYNSVALTKIRHDEATGNNRTELWYLVAPATGTNNVVVTITGNVGELAAGAMTFTGVDQSSPIDANNGATGNSNAASASLTTVSSNAWLVAVCSAEDKLTVGYDQIAKWSQTDQSYENAAGAFKGPITSASSQTVGWTIASGQSWALSAVSLKPATGGGGGVGVAGNFFPFFF